MKKKHTSLLIAMTAMFVLQGYVTAECGWFFDKGRRVQGKGPVVSQEIEIEDVRGVHLGTIGHVFIEIGDEEKLVVEAQENIIEALDIDIRRGLLEIEYRGNIRTSRPVKYHLTVKELEEILLSSSGDIDAPDVEAEEFTIANRSSGDLDMGSLICDRAEIDISSSGDINLEKLEATVLSVDISSSGSLVIEDGSVKKQRISISSSGDYKARKLISDEADVRLSSSGDAKIHVNEYLDASTSSSGSVYYSGDPEVDRWKSSSGDIRRVGGRRRGR